MLVARASAVDPGSAWAAASPMQQVANSAALALSSGLVLVHGLAAFWYGWFHFFFFHGFFEVNGIPGLLLAGGNVALAVAWGTHVWQRHAQLASRAGSERVRRASYRSWVALWAVGLVLWWVTPASAWRTFAVAPGSDLPLLPLPWAWPWLLPLATDGAVLRLVVAGAIGGAVMLLCAWLEWGRGMLAGSAVLLAAVGGFFLGNASFQFAASRGLAALGPDWLADYAADPARFNAWLAVAWWTGCGAVAWSAIAAFLALRAPRKALQQAARQARR